MSFTAAQLDFLEANRNAIEARRTFQIDFASATLRAIEGSTPWQDGATTWAPAHAAITPARVDASPGGFMEANAAIYRLAQLTPEMGLAHITQEAEWRGALFHQRLVLFVAGAAVGPPIHIHRGRIADIRRREDVANDFLEVRVEGPFQDRNAALLGKYTDRDQQMRSPGDRGAEYAPLYEMGGAEFSGWLVS